MGYRLNGPFIKHVKETEIVSDAILPGAIQVPKSGKPILMMRDAQTTGGYPKIAAVISFDLSKLGQAKPNDTIKFTKTSLSEARKKTRAYSEMIRKMETLFLRV
jgi:allophanate hydrolase subunit 2